MNASVRAVLFVSCAAAAAAVASAQAPPIENVLVRVLDEQGRPVPGAVVWVVAAAVLYQPQWSAPELWFTFENHAEQVRRRGKRVVADGDGELRVARATAIAAEHGQLGGFARIAADATSRFDLQLDDWRWTIVVRDARGQPVKGVPIAGVCHVKDDGVFEQGSPIGRTDHEGRLVVWAPGGVDAVRGAGDEETKDYFGEPREPDEPPFVSFEVDGLYMPRHAVRVRRADRSPATIALTMPPATEVEIRPPQWNGPVLGFVMLSSPRHQKPDAALCRAVDGAWRAFVGVQEHGATRVYVSQTPDEGLTLGWDVEVPRVEAGRTFPIDLSLDAEAIVVRARVHTKDNAPVAHVELAVAVHDPRRDLRTPHVLTDGAGRFVLVLRPGLAAGAELTLRIDGRNGGPFAGTSGTLRLPELRAGDRRDLGVVVLGPK